MTGQYKKLYKNLQFDLMNGSTSFWVISKNKLLNDLVKTRKK